MHDEENAWSLLKYTTNTVMIVKSKKIAIYKKIVLIKMNWRCIFIVFMYCKYMHAITVDKEKYLVFLALVTRTLSM